MAEAVASSSASDVDGCVLLASGHASSTVPSMRPLPTTTISTIAVQSGSTRIVIAFLQSKEWIELQVLEMSPDMTRLGDSFVTASDLLIAHEDVLKKLQSKQSPVEELLKQADQLIASQRPRAEVYAAMAESLGQAWKDLNTFLEQRRIILEHNVAFHSHGEDVVEKLSTMDRESLSTAFPTDVESVKRMISRLEDLRRSALESHRLALQDGESLLEQLTILKANGSLDSRPGHILPAVKIALTQVERWLEALHDRRRRSEAMFQKRRALLEQWHAVCNLRKDLESLEKKLSGQRENLMRNTALGDSCATAEILLFEHNKLQPEFKELQEKALKLTHQAEELQAKKYFASEEMRREAYALLEKCSEHLDAVDQRSQLLSQSILFFRVAQTAMTKLDQLEVQLTAHQIPPGSSQLAQLHAQVSRALEDATAPALHHGYSLLEFVGRGHPGAEGVRQNVELIESRGIQLGSLCTAHKEESLRITQAVRSFIEQYQSLYGWLLNVVDAFIKSHQDMRGTLPEAREVLELHIQMLNDLNIKGTEIDALLRTVNPLCEMAEEAQAHEVQMKGDSLHDTWQRVRSTLIERVDLMQSYVRVHSLAVQVSDALDDIESKLKDIPSSKEDAVSKEVEELWLNAKQKYLQLSNNGRNFIADAIKIADRSLDVRKACLCVESLLEYLGSRQMTVHEMRETWVTTITTIKETREEWTQFKTIYYKFVEAPKEKEKQLFPLLPREQLSSSVMLAALEEKLVRVTNDVTATLGQLETRRREAENLKLSGANQDERSKIVSDLTAAHQRLQLNLSQFRTLMQEIIVFFKNIVELDRIIETIGQKQVVYVFNTVPEVELALKDHVVTKNTVGELIKLIRNEATHIISKLGEQDSQRGSQSDIAVIESYLRSRETSWDAAWQSQHNSLNKQKQRCQFNADLHQINVQLDDLSRQLTAMKGQYGSSLAMAKVTSQAFIQFEKTIELLEARVGAFTSTAMKMISEDDGDRTYIERETQQISSKWSQFHRQVGETRKLIDLSVEYFTLVEEVEECFREGSKLLVTIARKSTVVKTPVEAQSLLREVEFFLKPGEAMQEMRIKKISQLAVQLYGAESSKHIDSVLKENRNMNDSFSLINTELSTLAINLQALEEERVKQAQTQAAVQESLEAAKAEAAAARAAASAAEEARRAAEAVALALKETSMVPPRPPSPVEEIQPTRPAPPVLRAPTPPKRAKLHEMPPLMEGPMFIDQLRDLTVEENKPARFECRVTGRPLPSISWLKDGIPIENNPDYRTSLVDGTCSLVIEETFVDDSAKFTCQASNMAGFAQTSATLKVEECKLEGELIPPEFTVPLMESVAKEGQPHQLTCKVVGHPLPAVSWYKNGVCVDHCPDYTIAFENGHCTLRFDEVFIEDQAEYTCKAFNLVGDADTATMLIVEPLEPTELPTFVLGLSNVMARTGQKVRLECAVAGLPFPTVSWFHNNKPIKETRDIKTFAEGSKFFLTISEAFPKDAGTYTAVAKNIAGETASTCCLAVKGRLPTETSDSELASDMEPVKPVVQQPLKNVGVKEGDKVRLDCVIVAQPEPEVIWYHDDRPIKESSDFQLLFQGDRCSLLIREAFQEDSGVYRVVAINSAGEASSKCTLEVTPLEETLFAEAIVEASGPAEESEAPKFTRIISDVKVSQGRPVSFEVVAVGKPQPIISWFKDNCVLSPTHEYQITEDVGGLARLFIPKAQAHHVATYTVTASNDAGEAKTLASLVVKPPTPPPPELEIREPPVFTQVFGDATLQIGEQLIFECCIKGRPYPKIKWLHEERPITKETFTANSMGELHQLINGNVQIEDVGRYSCVAENVAGVATCVAKVKIFEPIEVPDAGQSSDRLTESEFLSRKAVFTQSNTVFSVSGSGSRNVHKVTREVEHTVKQVSGQPTEEVRAERVESVEQQDNKVPSVKEIASLFSAKGSSGASSVDQAKMVKTQRKSVAPKFVTPLVGVIVEQNARVVMEAILDGFPVPDVKWYKNGVEMQHSDAIEISFNHNRASLVVKQAAESDAGRYTCTARNAAGTASSTADIVVRRTQFPPVFGRRLQAQTVRPGSRVTMEVEVTGTPAPDVAWTKNDRPITDERMTIKADGTRHRLVIVKVVEADSGLYTVRAVNRAGEAVTIAELFVSPTTASSQPILPVIRMPVPSATSVTEETIVESTEQILEQEKSTRSRDESRDVTTVVETQTTEETNVQITEIVSVEQVTQVEKTFVEKKMSDQKHPPLKLDVTLRADQPDAALIPEPPPKVDFAPKPSTPGSRREEFMEKARRLEEASKVISPTEIPGAVRLLPLPTENGSPRIVISTQSPLQMAAAKVFEETPKPLPKFEPFPELEPFPFKPDPPRPKQQKSSSLPRKPSKFVKGDSKESDYESDLEGKIQPRWMPPGSDTEESSYKKVRVKFSGERKRTSSETTREATPPSQFDNVPVIEGPPRPVVLQDSRQVVEPTTEDVVASTALETIIRSVTPIAMAPILAKSEETFTRAAPQQGAHKPSVEALAMEKAWVPKRQDEARTLPLAVSPVTHLKPSPKALEMEKQWSHKFTTHSSKIWPPPPSDDHAALPWSKTPEMEAAPSQVHLSEQTGGPVTHQHSQSTQIVRQTVSAVESTVVHMTSSLARKEEESLVSDAEILTAAASPVVDQEVKTAVVERQQERGQSKTAEQAVVPKSAMKTSKPKEPKSGHVKIVSPPLNEKSPKIQRKKTPANLHYESTGQTSKAEPFPVLEPFPFEAEASKVAEPKEKSVFTAKPSKFVKGEFRESDYESDLEGRIPPRWMPPDSDKEESSYRKVKPKLERKGEKKDVPAGDAPLPPTQFDVPPQFEGPPRPSLQLPLKPEAAPPVEEDSIPVYVERAVKTSAPVKETKSPKTSKKQKKMAPVPPQVEPENKSAPKSLGVETTKRLQMEESTQYSKRFVTMEQTTKVIHLVDSSARFEPIDVPEPPAPRPITPPRIELPLQPFPFVPDPPLPARMAPKVSPQLRPKKFVPGEARESDYESDYEGTRIRPKWTPGGGDATDPQYRVVHPPAQKGQRVTKRGDRTPTPPTVFDHPPTFDGPPRPIISPMDIVELKNALALDSSDGQRVLIKPKAIHASKLMPIMEPAEMMQLAPKLVYYPPEQKPLATIAQQKAASHFSQMSETFRSKAQHLAEQVISDVKTSKVAEPCPVDEAAVPAPAQNVQVQGGTAEKEPHAYHEESRASEFGTKHIDPDTGLIYFKYDFGYEFGLVLPGEAQKVAKIESSIGKEGSIELPVLHEQTASKAEGAEQMRTEKEESVGPNLAAKSGGSESVEKEAAPTQMPHFKPKKFTQFKATKWEPTTDSEVSDHEVLRKGKGPSKYYEERKESYSKFRPSERSPSPQSQCSLSPRGSISASIGQNLSDCDPKSSPALQWAPVTPPTKRGEK